MYRFVEQEKYEGKTTLTGGSTNRSLRALKHLPKIGVPLYVRGYVYHGRYGVNHVAVLVRGTLGTIRFGGFNWGYGGTGPRGLKTLFERLGIDKDPATIAPSPDVKDSDVREHWRIKIGDGTLKVSEAPTGAIVETIHHGSPSGNYYRLGDNKPDITVNDVPQRAAYKRFTLDLTMLAATNCCRIVTDEMDGF